MRCMRRRRSARPACGFEKDTIANSASGEAGESLCPKTRRSLGACFKIAAGGEDWWSQ